jgi:hypothetical protein
MRGLFLLFPATAIAVAGYVVLHFANHSHGRMKTFGQWLGGWTLFLSGVVVLAGLTAPLFGGQPFGIGPSAEEREARRARMMERGMMRAPRPTPGVPGPENPGPRYD